MYYKRYLKRYEQNEAAIVELEQEQLDLLHVTEFSNFNASEGYSLSKEVKEVRMKRRQLKNENELLHECLKVIKKMNPHINQLNQSIGTIRNIKKNQEVRSYKCRVRDDLQRRVI
ncbi:hypothetical protein [Piscibacillus salipiscarius]|uniref:hypothetical protein n=1 Tax=Piscibacillus salipiscarius TaxID=299480 RepID=UPI0006D12966|nr:hypothetical protein [Piscibacillus salipiscarius]